MEGLSFKAVRAGSWQVAFHPHRRGGGQGGGGLVLRAHPPNLPGYHLQAILAVGLLHTSTSSTATGAPSIQLHNEPVWIHPTQQHASCAVSHLADFGQVVQLLTSPI